MRSERLKRGLDMVVAGVGLIATSPLLVAIGAAVAIDLGRPVLFRQRRPGHNAVPFELLKFRTMRDAVGHDGGPSRDAERLTRFGAWLRATSLDELPELWNVLRGEMSLVGPRPLLMQYVGRYSREQARRHDVKPGITGWAQVNGRNALGWDAKFALDIWYVDHWTNELDLIVIAKTILAVLRREGISAPGEATMPEFLGAAAGSPADI